MKPEQAIERVAVALETMDRRMRKIEAEQVNQTELHESFVANLEGITSSIKDLKEMFLRQGDGIDELKGMLGNYIEATKDLRQTTVKLHSEVRDKLKAV